MSEQKIIADHIRLRPLTEADMIWCSKLMAKECGWSELRRQQELRDMRIDGKQRFVRQKAEKSAVVFA